MSGRLVAPEGSSVAGLDLVVRVERKVPGGTLNTPIARGAADDDGRFDLDGALGAAPHSANSDGSVTLEAMATDGKRSRFFTINAMPPEPGRAAWTFNGTPDLHMLPAADAGHVSDRAYRPLQGLALRWDGNGELSTQTTATTTATDFGDALDPVVPNDGAVDSGDGTEVDEPMETVTIGYDACYGTISWRDMKSDYDKRRWTPMHLSQTRQRTWNKFEWDTTSQSQIQRAYNGASDKVPYSGGLSFSRVNDNSAGIVADANKETYKTNMLKMSWTVRGQKQFCNYSSSGGVGWSEPTGERRYVPHHWNTGNRDFDSTRGFTCNTDYRVRWDNSAWVSRKTSMTFAGYFEIWGVKLDSKQTRDENHKISYMIRNAYTGAWGCGYKADPYYSSWVKEVAAP